MAPPRYSIDTSALIDGWVRYYPPDVFGSLWQQLERLVAAGRLLAPRDVLLELKRGGDDLYAWATSRSDMFVDPDSAIAARVQHIVNTYPSFLPQTSADGIWADPYVVALAAVEGLAVVTGEKPVGPGGRRVKIPNVCAGLGVPCCSMLEFIRAEGWRF